MAILLTDLRNNFKTNISGSFREFGEIGCVFQGGYIAVFSLVVQQ